MGKFSLYANFFRILYVVNEWLRECDVKHHFEILFEDFFPPHFYFFWIPCLPEGILIWIFYLSLWCVSIERIKKLCWTFLINKIHPPHLLSVSAIKINSQEHFHSFPVTLFYPSSSFRCLLRFVCVFLCVENFSVILKDVQF